MPAKECLGHLEFHGLMCFTYKHFCYVFYLFCPILIVFQAVPFGGISQSRQHLDNVKAEHLLLYMSWVLWMPWPTDTISEGTEADCGEGFSHLFSLVSKRRGKNAEPGF